MPASRNEKHQGRFGFISRLKPIIYLFYILVFVNGAVEITLRKFDPTGLDAYFTGVRRYFSNMVRNPDYAYIHKTHYTDHLSGADVTINKHGLRSPEIDMKKNDGTKRVMIMGDSVVFGWGVEQDSIFPIRLQKMLDKYILTRRKVNKTTKQFDDHSPQWEDAQIALEKLIGLCEKNDIAFVACIYGYDDMVGSPPLSYYDRRLKQLAVPVVTLPEAIFTNRKYHNSIVDRHPNAAGHKLIADELFTAIMSATD